MAPCARAYIAAVGLLGGLRGDHVLVGLLGFLDLYNEKSRLFLKVFFPFVVTGVVFDSMRYFYWQGIAGRVHVAAPYELERRVFDALLGTRFFDAMYARGVVVFGAYPSLHVAYPLIAAVLAFRLSDLRWARWSALGFYLLMCVGAVYLQHHYVTDVVLGSVCAIVALAAVRGGLAARHHAGGERRTAGLVPEITD